MYRKYALIFCPSCSSQFIVYFNIFLFVFLLIFYLFFECMLFSITMPQTFVVHLGNSKELMEVAEDNVARRVLREHVRESLGVRTDDLLFAIINSRSFFLMKLLIDS